MAALFSYISIIVVPNIYKVQKYTKKQLLIYFKMTEGITKIQNSNQ